MRNRVMVAALLALFIAAPARAEVKLAYVDVQRALNECEAGKKAKAEFRVKVEGVEQRLQGEQNEVASLKDKLEKKGMLMKPEERQALQDDYLNKAKNFERNFKDSKDELERKDQEMTGKIIHDLAEVIRDVGEKNGYTMVMEKGSILWGMTSIDITDQVIRTYNGMHVKVGSLGGGTASVAAAGGGADSDDEQAGASAPGDFGSTAAKHSSISK
ncbi:MAG TPA: OmpH family outer membrane protein [Candidatus Binataceae bacterium]|nr:OmpH family outer membrane protein [Candidatus Binataceae bacterium]